MVSGLGSSEHGMVTAGGLSSPVGFVLGAGEHRPTSLRISDLKEQGILQDALDKDDVRFCVSELTREDVGVYCNEVCEGGEGEGRRGWWRC